MRSAVFWLGDFNFRLDMPNDEVRACCAAGNISAMLAFDQVRRDGCLQLQKRNAPWGAQRMRRRGAVLCALQLRLVQEKGLAFVGMIEPEITFLPTYKYDNGTNNYDTRCVGWVGRRSTANAGPLTLPCDGRRLGPQRKDADSRMVRPHPVQG